MLEWKPNKLEQAVLEGRRCGYCRRETTIDEVWQRAECKPCEAYVTLNHKGIPNGRVAKRELRQLRQAAHRAFDPLWQSGEMTRREAYAWLSAAMNLPFEHTHIGRFGETSCARVVILCEEYLETAKYLNTLRTN